MLCSKNNQLYNKVVEYSVNYVFESFATMKNNVKAFGKI